MIITKYRDILTGHEFSTLPRIHNNRSPITEANFHLAGLEKITVEIPDPEPPVKHYSILALKRALVAAGLWPSVKAAIVEADKYDDMAFAQDLAEDDPDFIAMKAAITAQFPVDAESILQGCELGAL